MTDIKQLLLDAADRLHELSDFCEETEAMKSELRAAAESMGEPLAVYDHQCCEDHAAALEVEIQRRWEGNEISAREHAEEIAAIKNSVIGPPAESLGEPVAWMVRREGDRTYPRMLHTEAEATVCAAIVKLRPLATIHPLYLAPPPPAVTDAMINKLLSWPLPESLISDHCATQPGTGRSGTNLMTYGEAKQMLEHVLTAPEQPKADAVPEGYVLVPLELTAENRAKMALIGEFHETLQVDCPMCEGGEYIDEDADCMECDGAAVVNQRVPIRWTTIKDIHKAMVAHFAAVTEHPKPAVPDGWREAIGRVRDNVCPGGEGAAMRAEREIAGVCLDAVEEELAMIEAATEQPKAGAVAEGWQLVPVEPTRAMLLAGSCQTKTKDIYSAMLAASQEADHEQEK